MKIEKVFKDYFTNPKHWDDFLVLLHGYTGKQKHLFYRNIGAYIRVANDHNLSACNYAYVIANLIIRGNVKNKTDRVHFNIDGELETVSNDWTFDLINDYLFDVIDFFMFNSYFWVTCWYPAGVKDLIATLDERQITDYFERKRPNPDDNDRTLLNATIADAITHLNWLKERSTK